MKSDNLQLIWSEVEKQYNSHERSLQRMVYVDLLYRVYIGTSGIPGKRFLSMEIPEKDMNQFASFTVPQGFSLVLGKPGIEHSGYMACVLQAATSDQNDVFAIVAKDVLDSLRKQKEASKYIDTMKKRIEKWSDFFKNPSHYHLPEKEVIGLMGELTLIKELRSAGINGASDFWNGPIQASQDFQGEKVAIEVKSSMTNKMEYVHVSSEIQLDLETRNALFLVAYRLERNEATGMTLPELICQISDELDEQQLARFNANLTCIGYTENDKELYPKRYSVMERRIFSIQDGFPRILRADLPQGIMDINYRLALQVCRDFEVEFETLQQAIERYEYGRS